MVSACHRPRIRQTGRVIILAATPIGNIGDASMRLRETLEHATFLAAEDTRTAQRLLSALQIQNRPQLRSLHEHNERDRAAELIETARSATVVVVSDAGMPTVSDPGYVLVREAIAAGVEVTAIPGPSAVLTALALSGLPTDRFTFEGFLPRKAGERRAVLRELAAERRTMVMFEAPHRIADSLRDAAWALGHERYAAVCRELTKRYEQVKRGTLSELAEWASEGVRGEIVVVIAGAAEASVDLETALDMVDQLVNDGTRLKTATTEVAALTGIGSKTLYEYALKRKP